MLIHPISKWKLRAAGYERLYNHGDMKVKNDWALSKNITGFPRVHIVQYIDHWDMHYDTECQHGLPVDPQILWTEYKRIRRTRDKKTLTYEDVRSTTKLPLTAAHSAGSAGRHTPLEGEAAEG